MAIYDTEGSINSDDTEDVKENEHIVDDSDDSE